MNGWMERKMTEGGREIWWMDSVTAEVYTSVYKA